MLFQMVNSYSLIAFQPGEHTIELEMVFRSNPGFVFHDSCGFEAGGASELNKVKEFVAERSKKRDLCDRVHAIW